MKLLAIPVAGLLVGLLAFPVLFASGDMPLVGCGAIDGELEVVLRTIRTVESGGDYTARVSGSSASGAYQFLDSTWAGYGGYAQAWRAPPAIQDAEAAAQVHAILDHHGGDIAAVPVAWYLGHVPHEWSLSWDRVPAPEAGNRLTPREYRALWLNTYAELLAAAEDEETAEEAGAEQGENVDEVPQSGGGCIPGIAITPFDGGWAVPAPADLFAEAPVDWPHHDYPAWDWSLPVGTPIYAVRGGTVTSAPYWRHNWWDRGCTELIPACSTCGIGVTVTDSDGNRWAYCHGNAVHVAVGQTVTAGTQLLSSGNTGRSSGPHLHLQIRTADGQLRCPQHLLRSLRDDKAGFDPTELPTSGCFY